MPITKSVTSRGSGVSVRLPDLFVDIMAGDEVANPHYDAVKPVADKWFIEVLKMDGTSARRSARADLAYLSALWVPSADKQGLRLMADWNHWVFVFDDQFDEGHLKTDPLKAAEEIVSSLAILDDNCPPVAPRDDPIGYVFQTVWRQFSSRASASLQQRMKRLHRDYMLGCLRQVHWAAAGHQILTIEQYMDYRRGAVGTYPAFAIVECATGVDLPPSVMDHPAIKVCEEIITDIVILGNDILSLRKDMEYGVDHNIIVRFQALGLSLQESVDRASQMLDACYTRWHEAVALLPECHGDDAELAGQVARLIEGYINVGLGTLYWSFRSGRYLGEDGPMIRKTGILELPETKKPEVKKASGGSVLHGRLSAGTAASHLHAVITSVWSWATRAPRHKAD